MPDLYQQYADEQTFLGRFLPLLCIQVMAWLFFQPKKLGYYQTLSDDIRHLDSSQYSEEFLKLLFLDDDYHSYLSSHTTGHRLQYAIRCILITVMMIFAGIPFLGASIGIIPYFSTISPILMMVVISIVWLFGCLMAVDEDSIGFVSLFSATVVAIIVLLMIITAKSDSLTTLDAPSKGLIMTLFGYALFFFMVVISGICSSLTFAMGLIAELTVNHVIRRGKWHPFTISIPILLVISYTMLVWTYVFLVT